MQRILSLLLAAGLLLTLSCETDFSNPNNPTDEDVLNSREGLIALSAGNRQLYSVSGLRWLIETPAVTTREVGITTTFQNMIELEDGGAALPNFNGNIEGLWSTMLRVVVNSNNLIEAADDVGLSDATRNDIVAFANLLKGMALGALSQHYEQVVVEPSIDNDAAFVSREQGFTAALAALDAAESAASGGVTDEFQTTVLGGIDLINTIRAMQARFNLYAGNYSEAISAAQSVDQSVLSVFEYDLMNENPIWRRVFLNNAPNFKPRVNFGLPGEFDIDDEDGRVDFYLTGSDTTNQNGLPIRDLAGFFTQPTDPIPVYLPDEMDLIIAEAALRGSGDTDTAVERINAVRTDTDDPSGVVAGEGEYEGDVSVEALLDEVYRQRRIELFLTGQSLEDSRRFGRPQPSTETGVFTDERNRNFYPYPERERNNNPNTPADPAI